MANDGNIGSVVRWCYSDEKAFIARDQTPFKPEWEHFDQIEAHVLPLVPKNATRLRIEFVREDGSGRKAIYHQRSPGLWVSVWADNIVPHWFPLFFLLLFFGVPIVGFLICWWLGIK